MKTFQGKFPHIKGMRCPRCDLPVVDTPHTTIVYACAGCGRSYVHKEGKMITIEAYLDPENIFQFENYTELSPTFQALLKEERNQYEMNSPMNRIGIVEDHLERYRVWAKHGFQCMQMNQMEEAVYSMVMALRDDQTNPRIWLNIAQMITNFNMDEIADRAIAIAQELEPNYKALPRTLKRIKASRKNWKKNYRTLSENQKKSASLQIIAEEGIKRNNFPRSLIRLKQSVAFDSTNQRAWNNIASLSLQLGDINTGKDALEKSLSINSHDPNVHYIYMNLYLAQDNFPMAIQKVKDALALDPNNSRFKAKLRELENSMISNSQFSSYKTSTKKATDYMNSVDKFVQKQKSEHHSSYFDDLIKKIICCPLFCILTVILFFFLMTPR